MNPGLYTLASMTVSDNGFVTAASSNAAFATNTMQQQQTATLEYISESIAQGADGGVWGIAP